MSIELLVGLIGGGSAILGSIVGAIASYKAAKIGFDARQLRGGLKSALANLLVFHELEKAYTIKLAEKMQRSAQAIKKEVREAVREAEKGYLTEDSEPARVKGRLAKLAESD